MNIKYDKNIFEYKQGLSWKSRLIILAMITVVIATVALAVNLYREKYLSIYNDPNGSEYYAFFLNNDQVYFGKLLSNNKEEVVISKVYYVSSNENTTTDQSGQPQFQLIKLGNELHGPTDKMYINRNQVLFYEQLRKDSKIVESISGLEKKK